MLVEDVPAVAAEVQCMKLRRSLCSMVTAYSNKESFLLTCYEFID
jgi:hypothetical protein